MLMKILVTGGSGFIGTNVIEYYCSLGHYCYNIDISSPRNPDYISNWIKADICEPHNLKEHFDKIKPDYVIHLAAATDLNENDGLEYYKANTAGVENIINLCFKDSSVKRVIFASSMLVNEVGYIPKHLFDYKPNTLYGKSKVIGEQLVFENKKNLTEFCIIRPTSIWGEWFSTPYKNFFDFVLAGRFFHPGNKACTKTYGYVGNSVYQINQLLSSESTKINGKVFYIGDEPAIHISHWADEIAQIANITKPKRIPFIIFVMVGWLGDFLKKINISFPMTSFRLKNMTTNHIIDLSSTYTVCGQTPFSRKDGIIRTLKWMKVL